MEGGDFLDTLVGEGDHLGHLVGGEGAFFSASLEFDEVAGLGHDDVEIHGGVAVLGVVEVEDGFVIIDAGGDGGDEFGHGEVVELAGGHEFVEGDGGGDAAAGDGGGAGAAVCLEDVAIDPEGAGAEFLRSTTARRGAADEALDLGGSAVDFSTGDVAGFAVVGGVGEHAVFGRDPAALRRPAFSSSGGRPPGRSRRRSRGYFQS